MLPSESTARMPCAALAAATPAPMIRYSYLLLWSFID